MRRRAPRACDIRLDEAGRCDDPRLTEHPARRAGPTGRAHQCGDGALLAGGGGRQHEDRALHAERLPPAAEAERANTDSFFFTNITPQHQAFNQSRRHGLWGLLENAFFEDVDVANLRIAVFGGPVFHDDDLEYRDVMIPRDFWKLIAYHDNGDNKTKVRAYLLTQRALLDDLEVLDLDPFQLYQIPLDRLHEETGLDFSALADYDAFTTPDGIERLDVKVSRARPINTVEDILG
jgi:endonuclease G